MAIYRRSEGIIDKLKLAGLAILALLLLYCCSAIQSAVQTEMEKPKTEEAIEMLHQVPLGYRPLAVASFVVDAEKNDSYRFYIGVKDGAILRGDCILNKYIRGNVIIYNLRTKQIVYDLLVPTASSYGDSDWYSKSYFNGSVYPLELKKGVYIIHPVLYIASYESIKPEILLDFRRARFFWK